jgi:hypothetical protein
MKELAMKKKNYLVDGYGLGPAIGACFRTHTAGWWQFWAFRHEVGGSELDDRLIIGLLQSSTEHRRARPALGTELVQ